MESRGQKFRRLLRLAASDPRELVRRGKVRTQKALWVVNGALRRPEVSAGAQQPGFQVEYLKATGALHHHFTLHDQRVPELSFEFTAELPFGYDAALERDGRRLRVLLSSAAPEISVPWLKHRLPCYAYWLAATPSDVKRLTVTMSDGNHPMSGKFAPSTNLQRVIAIPDPYFFESSGFARFREVSERDSPAWSDRSNVLVWRGAMTGTGLFDPRLAFERPWLAAQRIQACARLRDVADTDAKFAYSSRPEIPIEAMEAFRLRGALVDEPTWVGRKYALDIDGYSNAWQNLIVRLHLGCCVLKVASQYDYRQWYYDRLHAWEHYVPVKADLSDLLEQIDWVRANDKEASQIARRGQALARSLTWDAVRAEAAALISANWDAPQAS